MSGPRDVSTVALLSSKAEAPVVRVCLQCIAATVGAYSVMAGWSGLVGVLGALMGMAPGEAAALGFLTGFVIWLAPVFWVFGSIRPVRASLVVLASGGVLVAAAMLLSRAL